MLYCCTVSVPIMLSVTLLQFCVSRTGVISDSTLIKGRQFISGVIGQKLHNDLSVYCNSDGLREH